MDLIVLADAEGIVDMTAQAIAARTRYPLEMVLEAIAELESPDPQSRTCLHDGKRLLRLDEKRGWGWRIVNYNVYRDIKCETDRKLYLRNYMRKYRKRTKKAPVNTVNNSSLHVNRSPSSYSSSCTEGGTGGNEDRLPSGFPDTADEAKAHAAFVGCSEEFAVTLWNTCVGRGGKDAKGILIRSFRHHLAAMWQYHQERVRENGGNGKPDIGKMPLGLQVEALKKAILEHPANKESVLYNANCTDSERERLRGMRHKLRDLESRITQGIMNAH